MILSGEVILITITDNYAASVTAPDKVRCNQPSLRKQRISFLHNEADHSRMLLDLEGQLSSIMMC